MPELIRTKTVTARKAHYCWCCGAVAVSRGETYVRTTYSDAGSAYNSVSCTACAELVRDVWAWGTWLPDGITDDDYIAWSEEHPDDERAQAFLARYFGEETSHAADR